MLLNKFNILLFIGLFFQTPLAYTVSKPLRVSLMGVLGLIMTGIFFILIREAKASKTSENK